MKIQFEPQGVCSKQVYVEISDDNKIVEVAFMGGCPGNLQGIARLVKGMDVNEVIEKLEGISCGGKPTSCPDQLTRGLKEYLRVYKNQAQQEV